MVIVCGQQKGGVGKTTIAAILGSRLQYHHKDQVAWLDADEQHSLLRWAHRAGIEHCYNGVFHSDNPGQFNDLRPQIKNLQKKHNTVIVDVSGRDGAELRSALLTADIWLAPFTPSQIDADTLPHLQNIASDLAKYRDVQPSSLINRLPTHMGRRQLKDEMTAILGDTFVGFLSERAFYRKFIEDKPQWNNDKAVKEIDTLLKNLKLV